MAKNSKKKTLSHDERLMELYDKLATQWARKVEANKGKYL